MKKLDTKGREKWEAAKQKVDAAIGKFEEAYNKIRYKFKSELSTGTYEEVSAHFNENLPKEEGK